MFEDFLTTMEQMTDGEFANLLDELRPYDQIGPEFEEYMSYLDSNSGSAYTFVYDDRQAKHNGNIRLYLAA